MFWGFPTRSVTNWAVQSQKMVRDFKFWIHEEEALYYLCSENKSADQLRGYSAADLRLCFRMCKNQVFSRCSLSQVKSFMMLHIHRYAMSGHMIFMTKHPLNDN